MRRISRDELHAPIYYGPVGNCVSRQCIGTINVHGPTRYFDGPFEANLFIDDSFLRDAFGFEYVDSNCHYERLPLGCHVLVPHRRANDRRDYGHFLLARRCTHFLHDIRDLMRYVERFIH